jgi:CRP-like cAMP-binding protein
MGDTFYVIRRGTVDISIDNLHRRTIREGTGMGELGMLSGLPRSATCVAGSDIVELFELGRMSFQHVLKEAQLYRDLETPATESPTQDLGSGITVAAVLALARESCAASAAAALSAASPSVGTTTKLAQFDMGPTGPGCGAFQQTQNSPY